MRNAARYPFTVANSALGEAGLQPYVPIVLTYQGYSTPLPGLLDTGDWSGIAVFDKAKRGS